MLFMSKKPNAFLGPDLMGGIGGFGFIIIAVFFVLIMKKWEKERI